ncbi:MAG: tetratricopeptide repeat protein [Chitinophagaceae bacterium]|nr:MAG: tetratricopeptide repeat protein [Chitinophagaceae bacterium]
MATEVKHDQSLSSDRNHDQHVVDRAQDFWTKNSKGILIGLTAVVVLVGGYFAYNNFVKAPEEVKAGEAIWKAEQYYKIDSFSLALNGDASTQGFLKVISKFGSTKAGNLSKFYAGSCYLQLGDFNNAVKYLKDFSTDSKDVQLRATGLLGDAYAELGKKEDAVAAYKKAGSINEVDDYNTPEYLFRAGALSESLNKNAEAIELYKKIKEKYPNSQRAYDIDKYLARLGETK